MEAEASIMGCLNEPMNKSLADQQPSQNYCPSVTAPDVKLPSTACFDCSICMEFAADPVVTLCGHLYCWACIYKWMKQVEPTSSPRNNCPVCKSPVSLNSLIPLYARGSSSTETKTLDVPNRPAVLRDVIASLIEEENLSSRRNTDELIGFPQPMQQQHRDYYHSSTFGGTGTVGWTAGGVLGGLVLPWVSRSASDGGELYPSSRLNRLNNYGSSARQRRVEVWLHQLWIFLLSCVVLCLLFF